MSNTPEQRTQFQQKAQLRLQEMEAEWRRSFFERFREICREEMLETIKSSSTSTDSSEELTRKLGDLTKANEQAIQRQENMAQQIYARIRQHAETVKKPDFRPVVMAAGATILICALGMLSLRFIGGAALMTDADLKGMDARKKEIAILDTKVAQLLTQKTNLEQEFMELVKKQNALHTELRQTTEMQTAAVANLTALQQQVARLKDRQRQ